MKPQRKGLLGYLILIAVLTVVLAFIVAGTWWLGGFYETDPQLVALVAWIVGILWVLLVAWLISDRIRHPPKDKK